MKNRQLSLERPFRSLAAGIALAAGVAAATGSICQAAGSLWDRYRLAPPGKLVTVEGLKLHMLEMGERGSETDPVVVLETGLGGSTAVWGWIQPEVARFAKVVAFDREGLGWSEADAAPLTARRHARRVHAMLESAGLKPPYLLVGHSMGGLWNRVFHDLYPNEVCAVVLIDAAHPDQRWRAPAIGEHMEEGFRLLKALPLLAGVGFVRLAHYPMQQAEGLPAAQYDEVLSLVCSYRHLKTANLEAENWDAVCEEVRETRSLGEKPLLVISAGEGVKHGGDELQAELARLSSRGSRLTVTGADHATILTGREHALRVASEIRRMVELTATPRRAPERRRQAEPRGADAAQPQPAPRRGARSG